MFQLESTQDLFKLILAIENAQNPVYLVNFIESNYTDLILDYQKFHGLSENEKLFKLNSILDEFFILRMKKSWQEVLNEVYAKPVLFALKHIYDALEPWKIYSKNSIEQSFYMENYEYLLEKIIKFAKIDSLTINQISKYLEINILSRQQELSRMPEADEDTTLNFTVHNQIQDEKLADRVFCFMSIWGNNEAKEFTYDSITYIAGLVKFIH